MGRLRKIFPEMSSGVPQSKPLSAGETLGCTAPVIEGADCLVFVADGRFHLEAGEFGCYSTPLLSFLLYVH
jgi:diphthamide synthase subunit DPH2